MTASLPPIGCNGRGAQASSLAAPVSLVEASIDEQFRLVKQSGVFDFFDRLPLPQQIDEYRRCSARHGLPVATCSWFYEIGSDEPLLARNLQSAAAVGAQQHNIMIYAHDAGGRLVSDAEVVDFYLRAYDIGMAIDVEPALEYHVNMWSEDPRRISPVARAVQRRGVPFNLTLDYSHAIFEYWTGANGGIRKSILPS
jgi:sugar phosphate isomerase/epimerase